MYGNKASSGHWNQRRIGSPEEMVLKVVWLKHDYDLLEFAVLVKYFGHGTPLDSDELSLRETILDCEAALEAGLLCEREGRSAGSL